MHNSGQGATYECGAYTAIAYGYRWRSDLPLALFSDAALDGTMPDIAVKLQQGPAPMRPSFKASSRLAFSTDGVRFSADDIATIDTFHGDTVHVYPGPSWTGELPAGFYGTVMAALLTWRGDLAFHGSAVSFNGQGVLICGRSGAGKSTLCAALLAAGARLISDDLSVVRVRPGAGAPVLFAGRRALRLFEAVANMLGSHVALERLPTAAGGKWVVVPPRVEPQSPISLARIVVVAAEALPATLAETVALLQQQTYRPLALTEITGALHRLKALGLVASHASMRIVDRAEVRDAADFSRASTEILSCLENQL